MVTASAMTAAWIGFASGIVAAAVSVFIAIRQARSDEKLEHVKSDLGTELEKVKSDLAIEQHRGEALIDRDLRAEDVLARYREPLAAAAFDLQSRLYTRIGWKRAVTSKGCVEGGDEAALHVVWDVSSRM